MLIIIIKKYLVIMNYWKVNWTNSIIALELTKEYWN
jgi:hypothetical protein